MKINLYGGFGEKGRLGVGISSDNLRLLFDIGIKIGATGRDYYPLITTAEIEELDAVLISHAHEDHVGGLLWLLDQGFQGRVLMTPETFIEAVDTLQAYAENARVSVLETLKERVDLFNAGDSLSLGEASIATGRSGHVAGGVWFCTELNGQSILYSGDVVPESPVLEMDPFPSCDLLILDASYGADRVSGAQRAQQISDWIMANRDGCLLPTPLSGRSLELIALMPAGFAIHADMRVPLAEQIAVKGAMHEDVAQRLRQRLHQAQDWQETQALPRCPLLTHDGMGRTGPSVYAMNRAMKTGWPVLLTGHVPEETQAQAMLQDELADWIRLPTHPTLNGTLMLWEQAGKPPVIGHSCAPFLLEELAAHIPILRTEMRSGASFEFGEGWSELNPDR